MAKKTFAVIGLGRFGVSLVEELVALGNDVIAIDNDEEKIKKTSDIISASFICDSTDEEALKEIGITDASCVIIAFGTHLEATVLTTVLLKDLGVKHIIARVDDPHYTNMISKIGADEIITPQTAAGIGLANRLGIDDFTDFYKLDDKYSVVSLEVNSKFETKTIAELDSKRLFGVNIVLVHRGTQKFVPGGHDSVQAGDNIYVVGTQKEIHAFRAAINGKQK